MNECVVSKMSRGYSLFGSCHVDISGSIAHLAQDSNVHAQRNTICITSSGSTHSYMRTYMHTLELTHIHANLHTYIALDDAASLPMPGTLGSSPPWLLYLRGWLIVDAPFNDPMSLSTSRSI